MTCIFVYYIAQRKFGLKTALVAGLLSSIYPMLVFTSAQISAVSLYVFLNYALICLLLYIVQEPMLSARVRYGRLIVAGLIAGILVLTRTDFAFYLVLIAVWMLWSFPKNRIKLVAIFSLAASAILIPWMVRNYIQFDQVTSPTVQAGFNLWLGQHEKATGTQHWFVNEEFEYPKEITEKISLLAPTNDYEVKRDQIWLDAAIDFMKVNPGKVATLAVKKFIYYWGHYFAIDFTYPGAKSPLYWLPWFVMLPFFVYSLVRSVRDYKKYLLFYIYFFVGTATSMVFFVIPRYRIFILPMVIIFASSAIVFMIERYLPKVNNIIFQSNDHL